MKILDPPLFNDVPNCVCTFPFKNVRKKTNFCVKKNGLTRFSTGLWASHQYNHSLVSLVLVLAFEHHTNTMKGKNFHSLVWRVGVCDCKKCLCPLQMGVFDNMKGLENSEMFSSQMIVEAFRFRFGDTLYQIPEKNTQEGIGTKWFCWTLDITNWMKGLKTFIITDANSLNDCCSTPYVKRYRRFEMNSLCLGTNDAIFIMFDARGCNRVSQTSETFFFFFRRMHNNRKMKDTHETKL